VFSIRNAVSTPERASAVGTRRLRALARKALIGADWIRARTAVKLRRSMEPLDERSSVPSIHVNGCRRRRDEVADCELEGGVAFHQVNEPEWFGCATNHLFSRALLERFIERLERYRLEEAVQLPFSGTALELVWGFLPAWLGYEKWFTDGMHRVRKHFVTYRREDDPAGMASYINRYHRGRLCVRPEGDWVKVSAVHPEHAGLLARLPGCYR
jgi:hypothetical protein